MGHGRFTDLYNPHWGRNAENASFYNPGSTPHFALENRTLSDAFAFKVQLTLSLFSFVIIHHGHERKEIDLCLAAFIDPMLEN